MSTSPPGVTEASPHVAAKRRRRRAEILRAALRAFRTKGFHGTTLEDIARGIGVRPTALYHYFPDKESILYECHRQSLAEVMTLLDQARAERASPSEQLALIIREHVRVMVDTLEASPLAFEVSALSPEHEREIIALRDQYERGLRGIILEGIRGGEFRPTDPKVATFAILGAINWIARWYRADGDVNTEKIGAQFADQLVRGLTCH